METHPQTLNNVQKAFDDYVLYLGGLILETESLKSQSAQRCDLRAAMMYGDLIRDLRRYRDAITTTQSNEISIPPNVASWLRKKLDRT